MTITVSCDECFQEYRLNDSLAGKKVKCKDCGAVIKVPGGDLDEIEFVDDDEDDEDDYDAPPKKKGANRAPSIPKGRSRRSETPPPVSSKKAGKSKKRSGGYHDALDDVPTWVVLSVMWTVIGIMCVLFWALGGKQGPQIANAGAQNPNQNQMALPGASATPPPTAALFPVATVPVPILPDMPPLAQIFVPASLTTAVTLPPGTGPGAGGEIRLWLPQGQHALHSLGCVFMAPNSVTYAAGSRIGDVSSPDQVGDSFPLLQPCLNAGFAVVAYSVDGAVNEQLDDDSPEEVYAKAQRDAYQQLKASFVGLVNLRNAMEWVNTKVHQVNPDKLFVGGLGEAGSIALLAAAHEPRLKGCVVIDPVCDIAAHYKVRQDFEDLTIKLVLEDTAFLAQSSPNCHTAQISSPIFLGSIAFEDESDVLLTQIDNSVFAQQLTAAQKQVQLVKFGPGGDYLQNRNQALQQGAAWLKTLSGPSAVPVMP